MGILGYLLDYLFMINGEVNEFKISAITLVIIAGFLISKVIQLVNEKKALYRNNAKLMEDAVQARNDLVQRTTITLHDLYHISVYVKTTDLSMEKLVSDILMSRFGFSSTFLTEAKKCIDDLGSEEKRMRAGIETMERDTKGLERAIEENQNKQEETRELVKQFGSTTGK